MIKTIWMVLLGGFSAGALCGMAYMQPAKVEAGSTWSLVASDGRDEYVLDHNLTVDDCAGYAKARAHTYCVPT